MNGFIRYTCTIPTPGYWRSVTPQDNSQKRYAEELRGQLSGTYAFRTVLAHGEASKPVLRLPVERRHLGELRQFEISGRSGRTQCSIERGCINALAGKQNDPALCLF